MKKPAIGNTTHDDLPPIPVTFPLAGEWLAVNTPGHKIPSHGTDQLGQRFAYDFLTPDDRYLASTFKTGLRYWFGGGIPLGETTSLDAPILAPISGKVIAAADGWPERNKATPFDIFRALTLGFRISATTLRQDYRPVAGNYLIIEAKDCFAFLAHARTGSLLVNEGDEVKAGQHIANVGHTGNSTQSHLHFHLMDGPDIWTANGLPCCFSSYEIFADNRWQPIENGIPDNKSAMRSQYGSPRATRLN